MSEADTEKVPVPPAAAQSEKRRSVGFLLGLGIFLLPYVFAWFTLRKGHTQAARIVSLAWMALLLFVFATSNNQSGGRHSASASVPATAQAGERAKEEILWISSSCFEVAEQWGMRSKLTELQKKALWEEFRVSELHFDWPLEVVSVDTTFGKINAHFKCEGSEAFVSDVILSIRDEKQALALVKGQTYSVVGRLRNWGNIVGLTGDLVFFDEFPQVNP